MNKFVLQSERSDYLYHFSVNNNLDGTRTLTVKSQWLGAKNPDDLQTRFQCTFKQHDWDELISRLQDLITNEETVE